MIRSKLRTKSDRSKEYAQHNITNDLMIIEGNRVLPVVVLLSGRRVRNGGKGQPKHDEGKR